MGKHQTFTVPICGNGKTLELGVWCLTISETFSCLNGVIDLLGRCLIGEELRYTVFTQIRKEQYFPLIAPVLVNSDHRLSDISLSL